MSRVLLVAAAFVALCSAPGCTTDASPLSSPEPALAPAATSPPVDDEPVAQVSCRGDAGDVRGYLHRSSASRFVVGPDSFRTKDRGYAKLVGTWGVFAVDEVNGAALAIADSTSPTLDVRPLGASVEAHGQRVLDYFTFAGLPGDQIVGVRPMVRMHRRGSVREIDRMPPLELAAYYSIVDREIEGVPVVDSLAWARFNAADVSVAETVYWPPLPCSVVKRAITMKQALADPATLARLERKLPPNSTGRRVVIRHSFFTTHTTFVARPSYDVVDHPRDGEAIVRHFTVEGQEFRLPEEQAGGGR